MVMYVCELSRVTRSVFVCLFDRLLYKQSQVDLLDVLN